MKMIQNKLTLACVPTILHDAMYDTVLVTTAHARAFSAPPNPTQLCCLLFLFAYDLPYPCPCPPIVRLNSGLHDMSLVT